MTTYQRTAPSCYSLRVRMGARSGLNLRESWIKAGGLNA